MHPVKDRIFLNLCQKTGFVTVEYSKERALVETRHAGSGARRECWDETGSEETLLAD